MKIAFTSTGKTMDSQIDPRFGRTEFFIVFDDTTNNFEVIDNSAVKNDAHGAGTATAQKMFELKPDVLITGNGPGETAAKALKSLNMRIFVGAADTTIAEAYQNFKDNKLSEL